MVQFGFGGVIEIDLVIITNLIGVSLVLKPHHHHRLGGCLDCQSHWTRILRRREICNRLVTVLSGPK